MEMNLGQFLFQKKQEENAISLHFKKLTLSLNIKQIKYIFFQIVDGIDHLHANGILHRDIKPGNILINKNSFEIKIADFGMSRHFNLPFELYSKNICNYFFSSNQKQQSHTHQLKFF